MFKKLGEVTVVNSKEARECYGYGAHHSPYEIASHTLTGLRTYLESRKHLYHENYVEETLSRVEIAVYGLHKQAADTLVKGCHDVLYSHIVMVQGFTIVDWESMQKAHPLFTVTPIQGGFQLTLIW